MELPFGDRAVAEEAGGHPITSAQVDVGEREVKKVPDILECHLMSGTADYILRIAVRDLEQFDRIHRECLSRLPGVSSMRSSFASTDSIALLVM